MKGIKVIDDAIAHVRCRKTMYLGREEVIPENLATAVANDALTLGAEKIEIIHCGSWWLISSSDDWLGRENPCSVEETFKKLVPLVGGGLEALRREILLTAFAAAVFTRKDNVFTAIVGAVPANDGALTECLRVIPATYRVVAFKP